VAGAVNQVPHGWVTARQVALGRGVMDHAPCGQGSRPDAHGGGAADQVPNGCKAGITFSVVASQLPVQGHLQQAPEKYEHERVGQKKYPQQA
jgi:hypothetical protein